MNEPTITFGKYVNGFVEWYKENHKTVQELFTKQVEELFDTVEDFAVEVFLEIKTGE